MSRIIKSHSISLNSDNVFSLEQSFSTNKKLPEEDDGPLDKPHENIGRIKESMLAQASSEADSIISKARDTANAIIMQAKEDVTNEVQKMFDDAAEDGYNNGYTKGAAEAEALIKKAKADVEAVKAERMKMRDSMEPEILSLIVDIITKIFSDGAAVNPQLILNLIRQGLRESTITGNVNIKVSQDDYDEVVLNKDAILSEIGGTVELEIIKDLSLKQLDCVIETPFGNIDCSLGQQLDLLKKNLYFILNNR